jgi:hypothetical protein
MTTDLTLLAKQAEQHPEYCGYLLRAFLNTYCMITLDDLARQLRCAPDRLSLLWLCGRPGETWKDDVERIARYIDCDQTVLARLLRDALELG